MLKELAVIVSIFLSQLNIPFTGKDLTGSVLGSSDSHKLFSFQEEPEIDIPLSGGARGEFSVNSTHPQPPPKRGLTNGNQLYLAPALLQIRASDDNNLKISARSAITMNVETGDIVYEKNIRKKLPVASLTKLMTALLAIEKIGNLNEQITISRNAVLTEGNSGNLKVGEKITAENLLRLLLVNSSNDAAVALAEYISGSEKQFVGLMNEKAKTLELKNTHFANSTGLDEEGNYSTVYDLVKLTKNILSEPPLLEIMRIQNSDVFSADGANVHHLRNTNKLLGKLPSVNIIGGKTGFTDQAGECLILITSHPENDQKIISVILGSEDRFGEMKKLVNYSLIN